MTLFTESFEGLADTANSPEASPGFFQIGYQGDFTFASGIRYIQPVPNTSGEAAYVGDFFRSPTATWFLGDANGTISTYNDVPDLNAYIGRDKQVGGDIGFAFPVPVHGVIATVDSMDSITLAAYDGNGKLLTGSNIRSVPVAGWDANLIFAFSDAPIAKVVFTGGNLVLDGLAGYDDFSLFSVLRGTNHDDNLDSHHGSKGKVVALNGFDVILGRGGDDTLAGHGGQDTLDGGKGDDTVKAGSGNDTLIGGRGHDKLFGGSGQDAFLFNARLTQPSDAVKDFSVADDTILLSHTVFSGLPLSPVGDGGFISGNVAVAGQPSVLYNPESGKLSYYDGDHEFLEFAKLAKFLHVTAADFVVV